MEYISRKEQKTVSDILSRFLQCTRNDNVYSYNMANPFFDKHLNGHFRRIDGERGKGLNLPEGQVICIYDDKEDSTGKIIERYKKNNYLIILHEEKARPAKEADVENLVRKISFEGLARFEKNEHEKKQFKVLAIVHVYNEEDVIRNLTEYLLTQGIDVYLIDNWSSDSSYSIIGELVSEHAGKVFCERFPITGPVDYFDCYHQLQRSEELSYQLDYDWYIHYDADEYRISPWRDVTLRDAIYYIDSLGYNLIENTVIDFKVTDKSNDSIFMKDVWFDFGHRAAHFKQIKTWKKCDCIDIKTTGGHIAKVENPRIFPLKILNRHYPLRSYNHAQKKIFTDRKPRFAKEKQERGWHGHYDSISSVNNLISDKKGLIKWEKDTFDALYVQLFTGVGIEIYDEKKETDYEIATIEQGEKGVCLYGAGAIGQLLYGSINERYDVLHWVDKNYLNIPAMEGRVIENPDVICSDDDSIIWIAVQKEETARAIEKELMQRGIGRERIVWKQIRR